MDFLKGCLPNKVEESLIAEEPRAVSGCQRNSQAHNSNGWYLISCIHGAKLLPSWSFFELSQEAYPCDIPSQSSTEY